MSSLLHQGGLWSSRGYCAQYLTYIIASTCNSSDAIQQWMADHLCCECRLNTKGTTSCDQRHLLLAYVLDWVVQVIADVSACETNRCRLGRAAFTTGPISRGTSGCFRQVKLAVFVLYSVSIAALNSENIGGVRRRQAIMLAAVVGSVCKLSS